MDGLTVSDKVRAKLEAKHNVRIDEIYECFVNRTGAFLIDRREEHKTDPPTHWFIAETNYGRELKVVFIFFPDTNEVHLRTAYEPSEETKAVYENNK